MFVGSLLGWLDAHAGAITAVATLVLVVITAAYVVVTYLLVREQRMQGHMPDVSYELGNASDTSIELKLRNIGSGTASQLTIVSGPGDGIPVDMATLGRRRTLLSEESCSWSIGGHAETGFQVGDLPLTMSYFDNNLSKVLFEVFVLRFEHDGDGITPRNDGSASKWWTRRDILKLGRASLKPWRRPGFLWRVRKQKLTVLLLDDEVRTALRSGLKGIVDELQAVSQRAAAVRERI